VTPAERRVERERPARTRAPSRSAVRRRRAVAAGALLVLLGLVLWLATGGAGSHPSRVRPAPRGVRAEVAPAHFAIRTLAQTLPTALQFPAAASLEGQRFVLLGGLEAGEVSTGAVTVLDGGRVVAHATLPNPQHDAPGALLGGKVYVFGGGAESSYDHILAFDPVSAGVTQAGVLPRAASDAAVAVVAETAYVVGGYDGQQALDTIVAWRPGASAEVVAHLPSGLRYAAVAASNGRLLIVGGTPGEGASSAILRFDPATRQVQAIGRMPAPITHAGAFALGRYVYLVGGRGAAPGTQSAGIVAIDPVSGRTARVGRLPQALSDAAVVASGRRAWIAGGAGASGVVSSILELEAVGP
jgi:hypothetical protein